MYSTSSLNYTFVAMYFISRNCYVFSFTDEYYIKLFYVFLKKKSKIQLFVCISVGNYIYLLPIVLRLITCC